MQVGFRSDRWCRGQHQEREARERKRIRELSATQIQAGACDRPKKLVADPIVQQKMKAKSKDFPFKLL